MYIAEVESIKIWVPDDVWYTFYNSPYIGHREGTAVDVYYPHGMLFPCEEGRVREIRKVKTPRHIPFSEDYLVIVEMQDTCLKILHVKPNVSIGEKLHEGDEVGVMILSGYFMPWSDRHAHIEFRRCEDARRARGGMPLRPIYHARVRGTTKGEFVVVEKKEHYYWLRPYNTKLTGMTPITNGKCSLEGGIPHYRIGAMLGECGGFEFLRMPIKSEKSVHHNASLFTPRFSLLANEQLIMGIGVFSKREEIKMIGGEFDVGDTIMLTAENS